MKAKGWQIIVIVLGLLVGGGGILWASMGSGGPNISQETFCVDVETGQLYRIDTSKVRAMVPAAHPVTGRICLVRCFKDADGKWFVTQRDRASIKGLDKDVKNSAVDPETGDLLGTIKDPIAYVVQKK